MTEPVVLEPLGPARVDDWLRFFDGEAFADNPEWSTCFCRCYVFGGGGFELWDKANACGENRGVMAARIRAGEIDGLLAYRGGRVIGWVHYGPTARFHSPNGALEPVEEGVASIVCFVVAPSARRQGVARELLRGALAALQRAGFRAVDARPRPGDHPAMEHFPGPVDLYASEGFEIVERTPERLRVRRAL